MMRWDMSLNRVLRTEHLRRHLFCSFVHWIKITFYCLYCYHRHSINLSEPQ